MKKNLLWISALALVCTLLISSCTNEDYTPLQTSSRSCGIEIVCTGPDGKDLLADKSFANKIYVEGTTSHSAIAYSINKNGDKSRLCFEADIPDRSDMKWTNDRREATGMSRMTVKFGKQRAQLKCYFKFTANRPPAAMGGTLTLEKVEYNNRSYSRTGGVVPISIQFKANGKL